MASFLHTQTFSNLQALHLNVVLCSFCWDERSNCSRHENTRLQTKRLIVPRLLTPSYFNERHLLTLLTDSSCEADDSVCSSHSAHRGTWLHSAAAKFRTQILTFFSQTQVKYWRLSQSDNYRCHLCSSAGCNRLLLSERRSREKSVWGSEVKVHTFLLCVGSAPLLVVTDDRR